MTYLVTEDDFDSELWKRLLAARGVLGVKVVAAGGRSAAAAAANTLLALKGEPVATIVDAETINEARAQETKGLIHRNISFNAADVPSEVFLATPRTESLLIADDAFTQRIFGHRFDAKEVKGMLRGKEWPTLARLLGASGRDAFERCLLRRLDEDELATDRLAQNQLVTDVCGFLEDPYRWRPSVVSAAPSI